jgi:hypothetical protein
MSCFKHIGRNIDYAAIQRGRERYACVPLTERDAWLADKESPFARIVPARRPDLRERGGQ